MVGYHEMSLLSKQKVAKTKIYLQLEFMSPLVTNVVGAGLWFSKYSYYLIISIILQLLVFLLNLGNIYLVIFFSPHMVCYNDVLLLLLNSNVSH